MTIPDRSVAPPTGELPLATAQLATRPSRAARPEVERHALVLLTEAIHESRDGVLQRLAETALDLCDAGSAGISVEEDDGVSAPLFRWRAAAGRFAPWLGGTMPRHFSPCGVVLDTGSLQLMTHPVRYYGYIAPFPYIAEVLLVPVNDGSRPIGTLWVVHHEDDRHFDREDAHALERLARFVAAALQQTVARG